MTTKTRAIMYFLNKGYTIKEDSKNGTCYRVYNNKQKLYIVLYSGEWSIGETTNYKLEQYDVAKPIQIDFTKKGLR